MDWRSMDVPSSSDLSINLEFLSKHAPLDCPQHSSFLYFISPPFFIHPPSFILSHPSFIFIFHSFFVFFFISYSFASLNYSIQIIFGFNQFFSLFSLIFFSSSENSFLFSHSSSFPSTRFF